jgi:hypothetical protein
MSAPRNPSVIGSEIAVEPDPDDWRPANTADRSEEARLNEADDDSAQVLEADPAFGQAKADADEADVIEQHQLVVSDDEDEDEDKPRVDPTSYE